MTDIADVQAACCVTTCPPSSSPRLCKGRLWNFTVCSFICCATRYADLLFVHSCALILRHMLVFPFRPSVHDIHLPPSLRRDPRRLPPSLRRDPRRLPPSLRCDPRRLHLTSGRDASVCIWDMPTKVQSGECAMGGIVESARVRMWRGGVQGSVR